MATNLVHPNVEQLSLPVPAGTASGDPVVAGTTPTLANGINGVAITDISAGLPTNPTNYATVATCGAWRVSVATNLGAAGALAIGDIVYYDVATNVLSSDSTKRAWGYALEAKGAGEAASTIEVVILKNI